MVEDLSAAQQGVLPFLPNLSLMQWVIIGFFLLIAVAGVILIIWAVWNIILKPKNQDYYKDTYKEFIALCKNNCPIELKDKKFKTSPDEMHAGVEKGIMNGYNLVEFNKKHYDMIVYNPSPFKWLKPGSWFSPDRIAAMNAEYVKEPTGKKINKKITILGKGKEPSAIKEIEIDEIKVVRDKHNRPIYRHHSPLIGDLTWYTIGTERVGFFEYAVSDIDLTPLEVRKELTDKVNITANVGILKELGEIVGDALHSNPNIRGKQKLGDEIPLGKR